ncbi:hypothetical protein GYB61_08610 [bacterium]|nr:hypothetical protein [bacterium]
MVDVQNPAAPSGRKLMVSTLIAALVAGVILLVAVLPAEYGRDPTGLGQLLGLTALGADATAGADAVVPAEAIDADNVGVPVVTASPAAYATEKRSLTLKPGEGAEIKAVMRQGQSFVFNWAATSPVHFDMHGEPPGDGDTFESYWRERSRADASGLFVAPFDGTHGWYWKNPTNSAVTIDIALSGFFDRIYRP